MPVESQDTFADLVVSRAQREGLHTAVPAHVTAIASDGRHVNVKLGVQFPFTPDTDEDDFEELESEHEPVPELKDVPVVWLGHGGYGMTVPLAVGSTGVLFVLNSSIDEWYTNGAPETRPKDERRFSFRDGVFLPGLRPLSQEATDYSADAAVLSGAEHRIGSSGAAYKLARADKTRAELVSQLNLLAGAYAALRVDLAAVQTALGLTGLAPPTLEGVASVSYAFPPAVALFESDQIKVDK